MVSISWDNGTFLPFQCHSEKQTAREAFGDSHICECPSVNGVDALMFFGWWPVWMFYCFLWITHNLGLPLWAVFENREINKNYLLMRLSVREKGDTKPGRQQAAGWKLWKTTHQFEIQRSAMPQVINAERSWLHWRQNTIKTLLRVKMWPLAEQKHQLLAAEKQLCLIDSVTSSSRHFIYINMYLLFWLSFCSQSPAGDEIQGSTWSQPWKAVCVITNLDLPWKKGPSVPKSPEHTQALTEHTGNDYLPSRHTR